MAATGLVGQALASGLGGVAFVFGMAALRPSRPVSAEAIQEHGMSLEDVCAAVMRQGYALVCPVRALLCLRIPVV